MRSTTRFRPARFFTEGADLNRCHPATRRGRGGTLHLASIVGGLAAAVALSVACASGGPAPSASQAAGTYRFTRSEAAWLVGEESHPFAVLIPRSRSIWIGDDGTGRLIEERHDPLFFGPNDRADWVGGSPIAKHVDQTFGPGELAVVTVAGLPTDKVALRAQLMAESDSEESAAIGILVGALGYLRETVPSPDMAELLYRLIAEEPGISKVDSSSDHSGRTGEAYYVDIFTKSRTGELNQRITVIFDTDSHQLLEEQQTQLNANPGIDAQPPVVIGWATYLEAAVVAGTEAR